MLDYKARLIWIIGIALVNPFALAFLAVWDHQPSLQWLMDSPTPYQVTATTWLTVWGLSSLYFGLILLAMNVFRSAQARAKQYTIARVITHYFLATVIGWGLPMLAMYINIALHLIP